MIRNNFPHQIHQNQPGQTLCNAPKQPPSAQERTSDNYESGAKETILKKGEVVTSRVQIIYIYVVFMYITYFPGLIKKLLHTTITAPSTVSFLWKIDCFTVIHGYCIRSSDRNMFRCKMFLVFHPKSPILVFR